MPRAGSLERAGRLTAAIRRGDRRYKHGYFGTRTYHAWACMIARCRNKNRREYPRYGGRGISVCGRWKKFVNFLEDMGEKPEGLSLDRIDNSKGYNPNNCRWATKKQQANNTSNNTILEWGGAKRTLSQWADHFGVGYGTFCSRWMRGYSLERLMRPKVVQATFIRWKGKTKTASEWGRELGLTAKTINRRIRDGEPVDRVLQKGDLRACR